MTRERLAQEWLERYAGEATNWSDMPKKSKSDPQAVNTYLATLPRRSEKRSCDSERSSKNRAMCRVSEREWYG